MATNLSTPLTGRKRKRRALPHIPVARILFGLLALLLGGFVLRLVTTDDPNGGRPSTEVAITSTRDTNQVANEVANGPVTITADPQQFPAQPTVGEQPPLNAGLTAVMTPPDLFGALRAVLHRTFGLG